MKQFILWALALTIAFTLMVMSAVQSDHAPLSPPEFAPAFTPFDACDALGAPAYETRKWEKMARGLPCDAQ